MNNIKSPNILFIMTDQQSAAMMSCAGNEYVNTPAMARLAQTGMRFERAYCTNPICVPSRFSLMTGLMPNVINLRNNDCSEITSVDHITAQGIGHLFKTAGYEAVYGGKEHLPGMNSANLGFDYISSDGRDKLAEVCAGYIREYDRDKPFFMVSSFD